MTTQLAIATATARTANGRPIYTGRGKCQRCHREMIVHSYEEYSYGILNHSHKGGPREVKPHPFWFEPSCWINPSTCVSCRWTSIAGSFPTMPLALPSHRGQLETHVSRFLARGDSLGRRMAERIEPLLAVETLTDDDRAADRRVILDAIDAVGPGSAAGVALSGLLDDYRDAVPSGPFPLGAVKLSMTLARATSPVTLPEIRAMLDTLHAKGGFGKHGKVIALTDEIRQCPWAFEGGANSAAIEARSGLVESAYPVAKRGQADEEVRVATLLSGDTAETIVYSGARDQLT